MNEETEPIAMKWQRAECVVTVRLSDEGRFRIEFDRTRLSEVIGLIESARAILRLEVLDMFRRPDQKPRTEQEKAKQTKPKKSRKRNAAKKP